MCGRIATSAKDFFAAHGLIFLASWIASRLRKTEKAWASQTSVRPKYGPRPLCGFRQDPFTGMLPIVKCASANR